MQLISFMRNLAIAGGLLVLARAGARAPSVDTAKRLQPSAARA
jgi:uncharacterized membrane protein YphA (DoxX/SURF4 family)